MKSILLGLILFTACLNCAAQTQRREGEIWFEPTKLEAGGESYEGERGYLMVRT